MLIYAGFLYTFCLKYISINWLLEFNDKFNNKDNALASYLNREVYLNQTFEYN